MGIDAQYRTLVELTHSLRIRRWSAPWSATLASENVTRCYVSQSRLKRRSNNPVRRLSSLASAVAILRPPVFRRP